MSATVTVTIAPRAKNLKKLDTFPKEPPVPLPDSGTDEATLEWCEAIRDHYEARGQRVSVIGLCKFADRCGLSKEEADELKEQVKKLYAAEAKEAPPPKPKAKPSGNGKAKAAAKPSANGHAKNGKAGKKAGAATPDAKTVYEGTVKGLAVSVAQTPNGRFNVSAGGVRLRKVLAWMGKQGFSTAQAADACKKLLAKWKNGEQYVTELIEEGHVGSGAKAGKDGRYCFGILPAVDATTAKALKSLRKE